MSKNLPDTGGEQELRAKETACAEAQSLCSQEISMLAGQAQGRCGGVVGGGAGEVGQTELLQASNACLRSLNTFFLLAMRSL